MLDTLPQVTYHRRMRSRNRQRLYNVKDHDDTSYFTMREVANVWDFAKDGKRYWPRWYSETFLAKAMRK